MDEKKPPAPVNQKSKLLYVMVVVFIVCGGNGLGLVMGGLIWRATGRIGVAIAAMIGITLLAFGLAVCVILACHHLAASDQPAPPDAAEGENNTVISEE